MDQVPILRPKPKPITKFLKYSERGLTLTILIISIILVFQNLKLKSNPPTRSAFISSNNTSITDTHQTDSGLQFTPLKSNQTLSYPTIQDGQLILKSITDSQSSKPISSVQSGTHTNYLGSNDPLVSPDSTTTAYITLTGQLNFVQHNSQPVSIDPAYTTRYLTAWSPDSTKLIAYIESSNLDTILNAQPNLNPIQFNPTQKPTGFYLFDTTLGSITHLFPLSSFIAWIDNQTILTQSNSSLAIFNINTFTIDRSDFIGKDQASNLQVSTISDSSKWLTTQNNQQTQLILSDFPKLTGQQIDQASLLQITNALLSPDSTSLIYAKTDPQNSTITLNYWDGISIQPLANGTPLHWIDTQTFIYLNSQDNQLQIFNLQDYTTKPL